MKKWCTEDAGQRGGKSVFYKLLLGTPPKFSYMLNWERDLSEERELNLLHKSFLGSFTGVMDFALVEANLKVLSQWYLVPTSLAELYPSSSSLCCRGHNLQGSTYHVWWECPRICSFCNGGLCVIEQGYRSVCLTNAPHSSSQNSAR